MFKIYCDNNVHAILLATPLVYVCVCLKKKKGGVGVMSVRCPQLEARCPSVMEYSCHMDIPFPLVHLLHAQNCLIL